MWVLYFHKIPKVLCKNSFSYTNFCTLFVPLLIAYSSLLFCSSQSPFLSHQHNPDWSRYYSVTEETANVSWVVPYSAKWPHHRVEFVHCIHPLVWAESGCNWCSICRSSCFHGNPSCRLWVLGFVDSKCKMFQFCVICIKIMQLNLHSAQDGWC